MKLSELLQKGASVDLGYEDKIVTWQNGDEAVEFDVQVKREISAADFEFIHFGGGGEERSIMARRVHRLALMEGEAIPFEDAKRMKVSLLVAIAQVLPNVELGETKTGNG